MFGEKSGIGGKAAAARMPELREKIEELVVEVMEEEQAKGTPAT
jgi:hypothetical protein